MFTGITEVGANAREINMFRGAVAYGGGNAFTHIGAAKKAGKGPLDEILTIQSSESESESDDDEAKIADRIAAAKPDILFVAMTSPKKEKFLASWSDRIGVPVCHGVGGSLDVFV